MFSSCHLVNHIINKLMLIKENQYMYVVGIATCFKPKFLWITTVSIVSNADCCTLQVLYYTLT